MKKGVFRFHTDTIKTLVMDLERKEQVLKDALYPFMSMLFQEFQVGSRPHSLLVDSYAKFFYQSHRVLFTSLIIATAELDCLLSLTKVSSPRVVVEGDTCRDIFR